MRAAERETGERVTVARLVAVLLVLVLGCTPTPAAPTGASAGPPANPPSLTLSIASTSAHNALFLIQANPPELHFNNGRWYILKSTPPSSNSAQQLQSIATGTLDVASVGSLNTVTALQQGVKITLAGAIFHEQSGHNVTSWMVKKDSGINTVVDLKGKTIATTAIGTPVYWTAKARLAQDGLVESRDYSFVSASFALMQDSVLAGHIDAGVFSLPWSMQAEQSGKFRQIFSTSDVQDPFISQILVWRTAYADQNPEVAFRFMQDWVTANKWAADPANHDQLVAITAQVLNVTPADLAYLRTPTDKFYPPRGELDLAKLQTNWDWFESIAQTGQPLKASEYTNTRVLQAYSGG